MRFIGGEGLGGYEKGHDQTPMPIQFIRWEVFVCAPAASMRHDASAFLIFCCAYRNDPWLHSVSDLLFIFLLLLDPSKI